MTNIIVQIIEITLTIDKNYKYLKDQHIVINEYDEKLDNIQTKLKIELVTSFKISELELIDYVKYLRTNYEKLSGMLTPNIIDKLQIIVTEMRFIDIFLDGIIVGYEAKTKALGNYSGLIYSNSYNSPVGGRKYNCSMIIVVEDSSISEDIQNMAEKSGLSVDLNLLSQSESTQLGLEKTLVISLCND